MGDDNLLPSGHLISGRQSIDIRLKMACQKGCDVRCSMLHVVLFQRLVPVAVTRLLLRHIEEICTNTIRLVCSCLL